MKLKKISFVITDMSSGGAERVISLLSNYFSSLGIKVDILAIKSEKKDYVLDEKISYKFIGNYSNPLKRFFLRVSRIRKEVKDSDVVISFLWHCNLYAILSTIFLGKKVIISERSDPKREMQGKFKYFKWFRNLCYHFANNIIFQSEGARKNYKGSLYKKGIVVANPLSPNLPDVCKNKQNKIVAVGRFVEGKNYPLMLQSYKIFHKSHPEYQLVIYGEGEKEEEIRLWIKDNKLENDIILPGFSKNVIQDIADAKLFLISSNYEGLSNSMLEALSMGIPVVATDCPPGGTRDFIKSNYNGMLVPINDVDSFSKAMCNILSNDSLREKLSKNALKIREDLSIEKIGKQWLDLIEGE